VLGLLPQLTAGHEAIDVRQPQIEKHQIKQVLLEPLQGLGAGGRGFCCLAPLVQEPEQSMPEGRVVFHHQQLHA